MVAGFDERPRRTRARSPRTVPWEIDAPVGCPHSNAQPRRRRRPRRPRPRICLRQGCGHRYLPRRWNQRYCQDPECRRQLRRWQAARRQARRRQHQAAKAQHAQAERARRQRAASLPQAPAKPAVTPARGHAAKIFLPSSLCDRPGCFEPPPDVGPQPRALLWPCLPPGRSPRARPRTQVAVPPQVPNPAGTPARVRCRPRPALWPARQHRQSDLTSSAAPATSLPGRTGLPLWLDLAHPLTLGHGVRQRLLPLAPSESQV